MSDVFAQRPASDNAGEDIEDDGEVDKRAISQPDVSDVAHPDLVGFCNFWQGFEQVWIAAKAMPLTPPLW